MCDCLEYPKGVTFEEQCVYLKKVSKIKTKELSVEIPESRASANDGRKESTSPINSGISTLPSSTSSSKKQRRRHDDANRITMSTEDYEDFVECKKNKTNNIIYE